MDEQEYREYRELAARVPMVRASQLGTVACTIAYGYTVDRETWHAYVDESGDVLHVVTYVDRAYLPHILLRHISGAALECHLLRPDKHVYPDTVDYRFAMLMHQAGYPLPLIGSFDWTTPDVEARRARGRYAGKTYEDF